MASAPQAAFLSALPPGARLLIVRLRSLGDTVLATPALRALKQWRPDLRLSILLYPRFAPVLVGNPNLEEILELDPSGAAGWARVAQTVAALRRRGFAAGFNLHGGTLSALLTRLSGAPHRVGLDGFRFRFSYSLVANPKAIFGRSRLHGVENQIAPFYAAGLPQREIPPLEVVAQPEARTTVRQRLAQRGLSPGTRYAVLHPIANFFTKEWPFERYGELACWLEVEHGLAPVMICGAGEGAKLDAVARGAGKALLRFEGLPVPELVALVEGAALFVGNDSGPAHIAAALERPLVVLFGSSDSEAWRPWSRSPAHAIVQNPYACNPCRGDRCYAFAQPECILSITPEQVRAAVERVLAPAGVVRMA
ncbi:MAG: glycosyltransferase family 9 protein [Candidatus Acidiferrales bacterium]